MLMAHFPTAGSDLHKKGCSYTKRGMWTVHDQLKIFTPNIVGMPFECYMYNSHLLLCMLCLYICLSSLHIFENT